MVNVELELCYVNIDIQEDLKPRNEPIYISTSTYRQASQTLTSTQSGEFTTLLPFRFSSLNAIYGRNQASSVQGANATASYRWSSSINPNFGSFYTRIGQLIYPPKPVYCMNGYILGSGSESMAELQKSFRSLASIISEPAIKANEYNVSSTAYANGQWALAYVPGSKSTGVVGTEANAFAIGLELQSYSNRTDTIMSGINTLDIQMFFTANIYPVLTAGGTNGYNYTCDFFAGYDFVVKIQDGQMLVIL
jgi:hypothetical protein